MCPLQHLCRIGHFEPGRRGHPARAVAQARHHLVWSGASGEVWQAAAPYACFRRGTVPWQAVYGEELSGIKGTVQWVAAQCTVTHAYTDPGSEALQARAWRLPDLVLRYCRP
jgi:hypothetical protein